MSRTKKIAILAIIAMVLTLMPAALFASDSLAGANRIGTAIKIADAGWTTAGTVVLAPADQANLVDALAAAPLAGQENAPILLTSKGALNADVKAKIAALGATKVYVVGAIADSVVAEVEAMNGVTAEKLSGANRWATAKAINDKLTSPAGTFVVGQNAIADALSVASYAAANKYAIVLAKVDGTVDASSLYGSKTYLVGGTAVVKDYAGATRLGGANRFETNAAVAAGLTFSYDKVYVAGGLNANLVDALAVAPLAAKAKAFVALANGNSVAADVTASQAIAVGGVVTEAARASVLSGDLAVVSVSAINRNQVEVKFNKEVNKVAAENLANYTVNAVAIDNAGSIFGGVGTVAKLQDDKKTVIITAGANSITNNVSANIKVENVTDPFYNKVAKFNGAITGSDNAAPEVVSVTATAGTEGTKNVKIKYSEPIVNAGAYSINGVSATATIEAKYKKEVTLVADSNLVVGSTYTLVITSVSDGVNATASISKDFTVANGTGALNLLSVTQKDSFIALVFDKEIDAAKLTDRTVGVSATSDDVTVSKLGNATVYASALALDPEDSSKKTVLITVAAGVYPAGKNSADVTLKAKKIVDIYGNVMSDLTQAFTLNKDLTAPTLAGSRLVTSNNTDIILEFSEPIADPNMVGTLTVIKTDDATSKTATYTTGAAAGADVIVKSDGSAVNAGVTSSKYLKVTLIATLTKGTYTFTIPANSFADVSGNLQKSASTFTVSVTDAADATKPTVALKATPAAAVVAGKNEISIDFSEKVQLADVQNLSNYVLDGKSLPAGTEVVNITPTASDMKNFKLVIPASGIDADTMASTLTVSNIRDTAGNALSTTVLSDFNTGGAVKDLADTKKPVLESAVATADNKLELTFSEPVALNDASGDVTAEIVFGAWNVDWNAGAAAFSISGKKVTITKAGLGAVDFTNTYFTMVAGAFKDLALVANNVGAKVAGDTVAVTDKFVDTTGATVATTDNGATSNDVTEISVNIAAPTNAGVDKVASYDIYIASNVAETVYTKVSDIEANLTKLATFVPAKANGTAQALPVTAGTKLSDGTTISTFNSTVRTYVVIVDELGNKAFITQANAALNIAD